MVYINGMLHKQYIHKAVVHQQVLVLQRLATVQIINTEIYWYSLATVNSEYFVVKIFWLVRKLNARNTHCAMMWYRVVCPKNYLTRKVIARNIRDLRYYINSLLLQLSSNTILGELPISTDMDAFPDSFLADDRSIKWDTATSSSKDCWR